MTRLITALVLAFSVQAAGLAQEKFPDKPVRFIVPFPPGGGTDGLARILGAKLAELWGQQVLIENRAGAQGNIGTAAGAKAAPDGYTITLAHQGALVINPHLYGANTGYDTLKDFAAVARATEMAFVLVVHPSLPAKSMKELADLAKAHPGKLAFASTSAGPQMAGELFRLTTGTQMLHIPYKGGGPATADLLAGHVSIMFANPTAAVPHVKAGKLRALGVMDSKRNPAIPDVPSALEAGYPELSNVIEWYGVVVPAATPRERVAALSSAVLQALSSPDAVSRIQSLGQTLSPTGPEDFERFIRAEHERWGRVVKASGAKAD
ncbi:MAG TPA: tripartite tricarboxylate transporter substrate binding protein [Burkholderiales bacterium]|nr:tripartite tricarboxylate transporter substrate binding protein [Burkholderiales bacterium]